MSSAVAKLAAFSFAGLLLVGVVLLIATSRGAAGSEFEAEFEDAFGILEGLDVRIGAAPAGTVNKVELTDRGTSLVTMTLLDGIEPPRADATLSVRQQDLLGDTYVSLSPGEADEPLAGPIPPSRAVAAPRLDAILSTFRKPVREALSLLIIESGIALDRRGEDFNQALVHLRPALAATTDLMAELNASNDGLRSLVTDAERVSTQAARRSSDIGPTVDSLAELLRETSARAPALARGVEVLPETLAETRATLQRLARVTDSARPAVVALREVAPRLETTGELALPFVEDVRSVADDLDPTLDLAARALAAGEPTLEELADAAPLVERVAGPLDKVVDGLRPAAADVVDTFFGAETYGRRNDEVGIGAAAVEKSVTPGVDPARRMLRTAPVVTCESFGRPIEPGCLTDALDDVGGTGIDLKKRSDDRDRGDDEAERRSERRPSTTPSPKRPPSDAGRTSASPSAPGGPLDGLLDFLLGS